MLDMHYVQEWGIAFVATIALEAPLILLLLRRLSAGKVLVAFLTANCTSHPFLWFAFPVFEPYWLWVTTAEISIAAYEGLVYWRVLRPHLSLSKAVVVSLAANALSCTVGLLT
jgi:hypothetical protein